VGPETEAHAAPTGETIRCRNEHGEMLAVIARTTTLAVVRFKAHYMTDILQLC
jgi:hypothetical protein